MVALVGIFRPGLRGEKKEPGYWVSFHPMDQLSEGSQVSESFKPSPDS